MILQNNCANVFVQTMARGRSLFLCHWRLENLMSQIWMKNITERNQGQLISFLYAVNVCAQ